MTLRRHPSQELVNSCAAGTLRPGAALVVRAHLALCSRCRAEAEFCESLAGAFLESEPPIEMAHDALSRTLGAIDSAPAPSSPEPALAGSAAALPAGLKGLSVGRRRWIAPGVWVTPVKPDLSSRELVYMLRIGPGMVLPRHTHSGYEFTCVLDGAFSDASGRYEAGDFIAADEAVEHSPVVAREGACTCLVSTDSPLVMRNLLGRLLQPIAAI